MMCVDFIRYTSLAMPSSLMQKIQRTFLPIRSCTCGSRRAVTRPNFGHIPLKTSWYSSIAFHSNSSPGWYVNAQCLILPPFKRFQLATTPVAASMFPLPSGSVATQLQQFLVFLTFIRCPRYLFTAQTCKYVFDGIFG